MQLINVLLCRIFVKLFFQYETSKKYFKMNCILQKLMVKYKCVKSKKIFLNYLKYKNIKT